ncbi:hypothetical protein [Brevundimonas sp. M20]|uniref:hypothetical protein n=1 Tax=Brevundimonas sp. M20 TaxID=2591463 RepID=UPI001146B975|nr:hypothetical protein [Brevundimonas sp. M20]QDH72312.1 hypothetical protein FKQ52_02050 [Brevundimonas sp. M20]
MIPPVWFRRAAAVAAVGLGLVTLASLIAVVGDVMAVRAARAGAPVSASPPAQSPRPPSLHPLVRAPGTDPETAIAEYLNVRLGELGLLVNGADTVSVRPLGGGLKLAEMRITGSGDALAVGSVANWVAVNREAVRLESLVLARGAEGRGQVTLVLLMVVA